jgi:hypothetical protein
MATGVLPMKEEPVTDALLREFVLGKLADEERDRIESLVLTDAQTRERVLVVEQDLIDDYLENSLTEGDKKRFLSRYAQTDVQRRQLRITKSIKDWAVNEAKTSQAATATVSGWDRLLTLLRLKPVYLVPIAVTLVIAIALAIVWRNSHKEQRKHSAVEQELAQLNSPSSLREVPAQMIFLELKPGTVRNLESPTELKTRPDIRTVELHLPWIQKERYSTYRAEVQRIGDDKSFTIPNLRADDTGNVIRIRLPAYILSRGQYQIRLSGIAYDGSAGRPEEYSFVVSS